MTLLRKLVIIYVQGGDDVIKNYLLRNLGLLPCNPVVSGSESCAPSHSYGPTTRTHILIHYVKSGKGIFMRDDKTYELSSGMCFVIRPGEVTYYEADKDDPWHYIWIGFVCTDTPRCLKNDLLYAAHSADVFCEIEENTEKYNSEYGNGGVREAYLCGRICEILALLELENSSPAQKTDSEMEIAKNYIDTKFAEDIKIGELAKTFHFESSYFSRAFKKAFGISPQSYLVDKRLAEAARLMSVYGFSASAAASAVGYSVIYLFSKMFKRRYGVSPREYKKKK